MAAASRQEKKKADIAARKEEKKKMDEIKAKKAAEAEKAKKKGKQTATKPKERDDRAKPYESSNGKSGRGGDIRSPGGSILNRLGSAGGAPTFKVAISGLNKNITVEEVQELCGLVARNVKVTQFKPGSFDAIFDNVRLAKRCVEKYDKVELDGRPMHFQLFEPKEDRERDNGRERRDDRERGDRPRYEGEDRRGARGDRLVYPGVGDQKDRKPLTKEKREPEKRDKGKEKPKRDEKKKERPPKAKGKKEERDTLAPAKSAAEMDADMDAYFAAKTSAATE